MIETNHISVITSMEFARRAGISVRAVSRLVASGLLSPSMKLPGLRGAYLFDPADVEQFKPEATK